MLTSSAYAQQPIGEVSATDATVKGSILLASTGTRVLSGASITSGPTTATLHLTRGGQVDVCPGSSLSLANSRSGHDLLLGLGAGAIELDYQLPGITDTVMTPDFRILIAGPGKFHVAIGADARGNTCVRSLPGTAASVLVTEMMGDGVYQVRATEDAYFHGGTVKGAAHTVPPDCGCPAPAPVVLAASHPQPVPVVSPEVEPPASLQSSTHAPGALEFPADSPEAAIEEHGTPSGKSEVIVPSPNGDIHVQVDAPFVYRAADSDIPPAPTVATLSLAYMHQPIFSFLPVQPPPNQKGKPSQPHKSVLRHIGSFFAGIFK